jgi:hypothetical protein
LDSVVAKDINITYQKETEYTKKGTSLYVYEIAEGGIPKIINNVAVYKATVSIGEDNVTKSYEKGELLGETSPTGLLYISEISTDENDPTYVIVEKDGYEQGIQELRAIEGTANYIFISEDNNLEIEQSITSDTTSSERTLDRRLYDTVIGVWNKPSKKTSGMLFTPVGKSNNYNFKFKSNSTVKKLDNQEEITEILEGDNTKGRITNVLGALKIYAKSNGRKVYNVSLTELFDNLEPADAKLFVGLSLSEDMLNRFYENNESFKDKVKLYTFETGKWEEMVNPEFEIYTKDDELPEFHHADQKRNLEKFFTKSEIGNNAVLMIDGANHKKFAPIFAIHQEEVNTTADTNYVTYNLDVNVSSHDGKALPNAVVVLNRGNSGTEIIKYVSSTGDSIASFKVLSTRASIDNFTISVLEGDHYPITRNYSISDLTPIPEKDINSTTNINFVMKAPPEYAVVKGLVENSGFGLRNAQVELLYPLAMAEIDDSAKKVIENKEEKGVKVSVVPNAKYSWYVKKASIEEETTTDTGNNRTLNRVSEKRWTLVQSSTASDGGNFLPYSKVIAQALSAKKSTDESDIEVIASGKFQVALQVEHDIDGDGQVDFTELASNPNQDNLSNTDSQNFSSDIDEDYGTEIGFVSTIVDIDKMVADQLIQAGGRIGEEEFYTYESNDTGYTLIEEDTADTNIIQIADDYDGDQFGIDLTNFMEPHKRKGSYAQFVDLLNGNHKTENVEWRTLIAPEPIGTEQVLLRLAKNNETGEYTWVKVDSQDFSFDEHFGLSYPVKYSESKNLNALDVAKFLSSDKVINKLSENIEKVFIDLGIDTSSLTDVEKETSMFNHGFNFRLFVKAHAVVTEGTDKDKKVYLGSTSSLAFKTVKLKDYLQIDSENTQFTPPTMLDPSQKTITDRVGLYEFPVVPLQYGEMNENYSLLRVEASKLGYYNSPVTNVDMFKKDDTHTGEREDIKRVDLEVSEKQTYSVTVNVTADKDGSGITDALVEIDGIKTNQNKAESESTDAKTGSTVSFDNVIGGKGSERIVKVSVPDSNYLPVIKTYSINSDTSVNISLTSSDDIPDSVAKVAIKDNVVDDQKGKMSLTIEAFDKANGSSTELTELAELHVYRNGVKLKNPKVTHEKGSKEFKIDLDLEIGENEIGLEIANLKGFSSRYIVKAEYDPTIGSINGKVHNFSGSGQLVVDFYTEENQYFDTVVLPESGEYFFADLKAGETFKLQAVELNTEGKATQVSPFKTVTVPVATIFTQDFELTPVQASADFPGGSPVFDFSGEVNESNVATSTGLVTFSATISNFDKDNELSSIWFFVNDDAYEINKSQLHQNADFSYTLQDYSVQLDVGTNVIYGAAINPDSSFDWTVDKYVDWIPDASSLFSIVGQVNAKGSGFGYSYVTLYEEEDGTFLGTAEADENGTFEFDNLLANKYVIDVDGGDEFERFQKAYEIVDQNLINVEINLTEFVETIDVPDFYVTLSTESQTVTEGETISVTADITSIEETVNISDYTFSWKVNGVSSSETTSTISQTAPTNATSITFEVTATHTATSETSVLETTVYVVPQRINNAPEINAFKVIEKSDDDNDTRTDYTFEVNASDYEGSTLSYFWYVNDSKVNNSDKFFTTRFATGDNNVSVRVSDGEKTAISETIKFDIGEAIGTEDFDVLSIANDSVTVGSGTFERNVTLDAGELETVRFDINKDGEINYSDVLNLSFALDSATADEFEVGDEKNIVLGIKIADEERTIVTILDDVVVSRDSSGISMNIADDSNLYSYGRKANGDEVASSQANLENKTNLLDTVDGIVNVKFANIVDLVANEIGFDSESLNDYFSRNNVYSISLYMSGIDGIENSTAFTSADVSNGIVANSSLVSSKFLSSDIYGFEGDFNVTDSYIDLPPVVPAVLSISPASGDTDTDFSLDTVMSNGSEGLTFTYESDIDGSIDTPDNFKLSEGTHTITVEISNGVAVETKTLTVEVEQATVEPTNNAPVINDFTVVSGDDNNNTTTNFTFTVDATDVDGDTLSEAYSSDIDGDISETTTLSEGTHTITATVSDGNLSDSTTLTVEVTNDSTSTPSADTTLEVSSMGGSDSSTGVTITGVTNNSVSVSFDKDEASATSGKTMYVQIDSSVVVKIDFDGRYLDNAVFVTYDNVTYETTFVESTYGSPTTVSN